MPAVALAIVALPAAAQLRLPSVPALTPPLQRIERPVQRALPEALDTAEPAGLRAALVDTLLARQPQRLARDPQGAPIVRDEVMLQSPSVALLDAAQAAGFTPLRDERLDALGLYVVTLRVPPGMDAPAALALLRAADAQAVADFDHLYLPAGSVAESRGAPVPRAAPAADDAAVRVGLVDGGVDARHVALRGVALHAHGCDGHSVPDRHGTAVASLLVGRDPPFSGSAPQGTLYAADIYCGDPAHGSLQAVLEALAWLAQQRVPVINLSIVGAPNRLLEQAVLALLARGHLLVAAVGNDGPAAPPLYPAAYPGVVGVSAVDARRQVLPEAAQGPQVMFVAPGAGLAVAGLDGRGYVAARGTSFAAPLVAGLLARRMPTLGAEPARRALALLAGEALDLGAPGRDPVYGIGLLGESLRADPAALRAAR